MYSRGPVFFYWGDSICPWPPPTNTHLLCAGKHPPTTSTRAKEFRCLGWGPFFYHNPVSQVGTYSRSAGQLRVFVQAQHTPSSVRQQRFNCDKTRFITPLNTPCGCSDVLPYPLFITPSLSSHPQTHLLGVRTFYHTPWLITPPL